MKKSKYFNRELSWLEFDHRVLEEACDPELPLLERVRFLAIVANNLDEFFMVRVGGLQMLVADKVRKPDATGMMPMQQLDAISKRTHTMVAQAYACWHQQLAPGLAKHGVRRVEPQDLSPAAKEHLDNIFENDVLPLLTPLAAPTRKTPRPGSKAAKTAEAAALAEDGHEHGTAKRPSPAKAAALAELAESKDSKPPGPALIGLFDDAEGALFPAIQGRSIHLAVRLARHGDKSRKTRLAIVPMPAGQPRYFRLHDQPSFQFVLIEDLVAMFAPRLFEGFTILEAAPFRATLNADLEVREDIGGNLVSEMQSVLASRKNADPVRLEVHDAASTSLVEDLRIALRLKTRDVYKVPGPLEFSSLMSLGNIEGFDALRFNALLPQQSPDLEPGPMFPQISKKDVLLIHPYESFEPVLRFIEEAATDPDVLAIKQTLYRTSSKSPIVKSLIRAAEMGKAVTVLVELKARFDEASNLREAEALARAGARVIHGVKRLKTHAKACLVVRREPRGIRRYVHLATGNYNENTAKVYTDASLFSADSDLGADISAFFNAITGYSEPQSYRKIEAAPTTLRQRLLELIHHEIDMKKAGRAAGLTAKINALIDPALIDALYEASQAGVPIQLNVRGVCCLRPGVPGLSENIRVISVVDRFLEHSRIMHFVHGGEHRLYISSADWMPRNLDRRIELLVPVEDKAARQRLMEQLRFSMRDNVKARMLNDDGSYTRVSSAGHKAFRSQIQMHAAAVDRIRKARERRRTVFEPLE